MKLASNTGMLVLGIWLVAFGAAPLLHIAIPREILDVLAIAAGVLILMNK